MPAKAFETKEEAEREIQRLREYFKNNGEGDNAGVAPFIRIIRSFDEERRDWVYQLLMSYPRLVTEEQYGKFQKTQTMVKKRLGGA